MSHIFVSYSRKDIEFVRKFVNRLQRTYRVWWDKIGIHGGEDWEKAIQIGVKNCELMIVILSPDSVESDYVRFEYETALKQNKIVMPIVHKPCDYPVRLQKKHIINEADDNWFEQLQIALDHQIRMSITTDMSYLLNKNLIGDSQKTFGDLASEIEGSFEMDKHGTDLVALPLSASQYALTYLVGQSTSSLKRLDNIQLALQCSQGYNSDDFPVQVAKSVLASDKSLHMLLVRGPMMLSKHPKFGIQMIHGLSNDNEAEWRGVIGAAYSALEMYERGTNRSEMVHIFNIAPAALVGGLGIWSERGRGMTFYNFVARNQYSPVFTMESQ